MPDENGPLKRLLDKAHERLIVARDLTDEAQADCEVIRDLAEALRYSESSYQRLLKINETLMASIHQSNETIASMADDVRAIRRQVA